MQCQGLPLGAKPQTRVRGERANSGRAVQEVGRLVLFALALAISGCGYGDPDPETLERAEAFERAADVRRLSIACGIIGDMCWLNGLRDDKPVKYACDSRRCWWELK
jgi:hypothetical protein